MDVRTEGLLRNLEGYLIELVCCVKSTDEVNLVAEALGRVQEALKESAQKPIAVGSNLETLALPNLAVSIIEISKTRKKITHGL